jgi:RNA polymerase sigma-B factor
MNEQERNAVVGAHWYLCRRAARRFVRPGLDRADLEQIAAIGLVKAVDRYDDGAGTPFEAYAWVLMIGELMHYVRDAERLVRAPRRLRDLERRWLCAERELSVLLGREASEGEVARYVNASPQQARDIREYRASAHMMSLDSAAIAQQARCSTVEECLERITIEQLLSSLSPVERTIVESIHLEGVSVVELARRMGYSRRHITRLHRAAMVRLRSAYTNAS